MNNFFGIGTADSAYDKRRHINMIFMEIVDCHFYENQSYGDRLLRLVKSGRPEEDIASDICNDFLTFNEHNYLNLLRERYNLPPSDFLTIMSGAGLFDKMTKSPAGYGKEENTRLLVQMVLAMYEMSNSMTSESYTQTTAMIGHIAKGMRGIGTSLDQAKFERLFSLVDEAVGIYTTNFDIPQIEQYVLDRW